MDRKKPPEKIVLNELKKYATSAWEKIVKKMENYQKSIS